MDRIRLSAVLVAVIAIAYGMATANIASGALIDAGPIVVTLPWLLLTIGMMLLIHLWSHLLTKFNKFMMGSSILKVMFGFILIFGILALIDLALAWGTSYEIGIINWLKSLFGVVMLPK